MTAETEKALGELKNNLAELSEASMEDLVPALMTWSALQTRMQEAAYEHRDLDKCMELLDEMLKQVHALGITSSKSIMLAKLLLAQAIEPNISVATYQLEIQSKLNESIKEQIKSVSVKEDGDEDDQQLSWIGDHNPNTTVSITEKS